jgi:hypothetical protein
VGQTFAKTSGFRQNNDTETRLANLFGRWQPTDDFVIQSEYLYRHSERGDIELVFDEDEFSSNERNEIDKQILRTGVRYDPTPQSQAALALTLVDDDETNEDSEPQGLGITFNDDERLRERGYQLEGRFDTRTDIGNLTFGASTYRAELESDDESTITIGAITVPSPFQGRTTEDIDQNTVYARYGFDLIPNVLIEIGGGLNTTDSDLQDQTEPVGEIGITVDVTPRTTIRAAAYRTLTRPAATDQTLEPTNIAGFNKFFDDPDSTRSDGFGLGIDFDLAPGLKAGVEGLYRDVRVPVSFNGLAKADHDEYTASTYLGWSPSDDWAFSVGVIADYFETNGNPDPDVPNELTTLKAPVDARYMHKSGFFAHLEVDFVWQEQESKGAVNAPPDGDDGFVYANARTGYRFGQRGTVSIGVRNFLDQDFSYRDNNFRQNEIRRSQYAPGATFYVGGSLRF